MYSSFKFIVMKTVKISLYKADTGKWYGEYEFEFTGMPSNAVIMAHGRKHYSFPDEFLLHVDTTIGSRIILPSLT